MAPAEAVKSMNEAERRETRTNRTAEDNQADNETKVTLVRREAGRDFKIRRGTAGKVGLEVGCSSP